jgi:putative peptidoglycan lipid II flippase
MTEPDSPSSDPSPDRASQHPVMPRSGGSGSGLLRSNLLVAAGTALSRVTGLLRVAVFVAVIGRTGLADVYTIANETPNIVYDLLLGGVLSATLVPLFASFLVQDHSDNDRDGSGAHATRVVITISVTLVTGLTALAVVLAPWVFGIYSITPAANVDADMLRQVGTLLTRIFMIQILFYGLSGIAGAYLNASRKFFAPAWAPILSNLVIIAALLSLPDPGSAGWELGDVLTNDRLLWTLGAGTTAGIAAMALVLIPSVRSTGLSFRPAWEWRHPAVRSLLTMSGWTLGFVAANQVAVAVIRNLAQPGSGDAAAYFYAFTFFVLPHGLLAVSISTTFQPEMARAVGRHDREAFIHHASLGIRMVAVLTLPAGVLLFVLRDPIIGLAFQRGAFSAMDAANTARALAGFSVGLVGFSVYMFVLRAFYAHRDTRTPFIINTAENLLNIVIALVLVGRYGVLGLSLGFAIAYLISAIGAIRILGNKVTGFPVSAVLLSIARMLIAGVVMAEAIWLATRTFDATTGSGALGRILVGTVIGAIVYLAALTLMRAPEAKQILSTVARPITRVARRDHRGE